MFLATHGVLRRSSAFVPPVFADTYSFEYDGVSDYLDVGNPTSLQITGQLSISAWFKTTYAGGTQVIVGKDGISGTNKRAYMLFWSGSSSSVKFFVFTSSTDFEQAVSTSTVNDGNWHHVLAVNDGTNLKIYIDGVLEDTNVGGGGTIDNGSATDFYIGRREGLNNLYKAFWNGSIDEVAVWNSDQSANASTIYNSGVPNDISSLNPVSHWREENGSWDGSNWTVTDAGSGGNNATSVSMTSASRTSDVPLFDNKSFEYDGVADYLEGTTTYSDLNAVSRATFSLWVKPSLTGTQVLSRLSNSTSSTAFVYQLFVLSTGEINMQIGDTTKRARTGTSVLTADTWSHVLVTYDGSLSGGSKTKIFINGVDSTSSDVTSATSLDNASYALQIGRRDFGTSLSYLGFINEFSIWAGTDLRDDVSTIYNSGVANDLNNNGLTAPTTWLRAESSTWDGSKWTIDDENSSYQLESNNMTSDSRTSDVPIFNSRSLEFDGISDYVSFSSISLPSEFTISAWVKPTNIGSNTSTIVNSGTSSANRIGIYDANSLQFKLGGSNVFLNEAGGNDFLENVWQHILIVRDSSNNITAFRNGSSFGTSVSNSNTGTFDSLFRFNNVAYSSGGLDEFAIWNTDQSSNISNIYNNGIPDSLSIYSPIHWYRADGDTPPTLTDNGSGGNNATMHNFSTFSTDVPT